MNTVGPSLKKYQLPGAKCMKHDLRDIKGPYVLYNRITNGTNIRVSRYFMQHKPLLTHKPKYK